jgi:hypothetical protein
MWALFLVLPTVLADEGMWLPEQTAELGPALAQAGMTVPVRDLMDLSGHPLGAVVFLGGCSGSFVSPDGLVATNRHCVTGALQVNSDAEYDRARDGYVASDREGELSAGPTSRIYLVEGLEDVTDVITAAIRTGRRATPDSERQEVIDQASKALIAQCEEAANRRCRVVEQFDGLRYLLETKREVLDVRLVYAPPEGLGSFGGEIDNWMWPRHAGDFSLLRAYVAPDGTSAPYSPNNVPLQTPNHLFLDTDGVAPGELVWMAGFPGRTRRHALALELDHALTRVTPYKTGLRRDLLAILRENALTHPEVASVLSAPIGWLSNSVKYGEGLLNRLDDGQAVVAKQDQETALQAWIAADVVRTERWGGALELVRAELMAGQAHPERDILASHLLGVPDLLGVAHTALRLATEREKPDLDREQGFQERDRVRHEGGFQRLVRTLELHSDQALTAHLLRTHQDLPEGERIPEVADWIAAQGGVDTALKRLYADPALAQLDPRLALLRTDLATLQASTDPWIELACALESHLARERQAAKQRAGVLLRLRPQVAQARLAFVDGPIYPDADSTLRLTFGHVAGAVPQDGLMYLPQTTVRGMVAKAGPAPFDAPDWLLSAASHSTESRFVDPTLGDVPVAFLSTLEATGGNSGSATLNADGEFVGLVFDVTWESIASDWVYEDAVARSIHVDVRYLLWVLSVTSGAEAILGELLGQGGEL